MKNDRVYLAHISECLEWINRHTSEGREFFLQDRKTQSAALHELQVMAESTQRLSDALMAKHPEVEWRSIAAFRNVLVHDYLGIKIERIWEIIERDLPVLRNAIRDMMNLDGED